MCREHGISLATLYRWKSKYSGMDVSDARKLHELEDENRRLKQLARWAAGQRGAFQAELRRSVCGAQTTGGLQPNSLF